MVTTELGDWFDSWAPFNADPLAIDLSQLYQPVNVYMAWLLEFVRQNSYTHRMLPAYVKRSTLWLHQICRAFGPSLLLLRTIFNYPAAELYDAVTALPPGFLATLCCLACDVEPIPMLRPGGMRKKDADPKRENGIQQHTRILITLRHLLRDFECSHEETECSVLPNPELLCTTTVELAKRATLSCCIAANMISSDKLDFLEGLSHTLLSYQRMGTPATFTLNDPQLHFEMDDAGSLGNRTTATSNSSCSSIYLTGTTTTISIGNNSRSSNNNSKTSLIPRKSMQDKDLLTLLLNCSLAYPGSLESNLASMLCVVYTWEGPKHTLGFSPQGVACFPLVLRH